MLGGLNICVPLKNSYVEIVTSQWYGIRRCLSHEVGALGNGVGNLQKRVRRATIKDSMRRCQALAGDQEEGLHQNSPALILDFPASKTERNKFPLFIKRVMGGISHSRYVVKEMKGIQ